MKNDLTITQYTKGLNGKNQAINCPDGKCHDIYGQEACKKCNDYYEIYQQSLEGVKQNDNN